MTECLGCGSPTLGTVELDFTDNVQRLLPACESCLVDGSPSMAVVLAAFSRFGAMPLNPKAQARECPLCGAADERKCGCI